MTGQANEPTEREWLEGLRYEDKFPEDDPAARPVVSPPDSTEAERIAEIEVRLADPALDKWAEMRGADKPRKMAVALSEDVCFLLGLLAASPPSPQLAETLNAARAFAGSAHHVPEGQTESGWFRAVLAIIVNDLDAALASVAVGQPENTETGT